MISTSIHILNKRQRLMHMAYRIKEIAEELDIPDYTVRDWITRQGAPHHRDSNGWIWIIGTELSAWILAQHREKKNNRRNLNIDEFWCMGCDKPIQLSEFEITPVQPNGLVYRFGRCPDCGTKVSRGGIK